MNRYLLQLSANGADALARLNSLSGGNMTLVVVDADNRPVGTLTDGDMRRALLGGHALTDPVAQIMQRQFAHLHESELSTADFASLRRRGIKLLPVVSDAGRIVRLIDLTREKAILGIPALIMAGGRGERLRPATDTTPKPLLPLRGKAVIDYNIDLLHRYGITDITVATRYLSERIIAHFDGSDIKCVVEENPLGTIGAVALLPRHDIDNLLVMNSDLLTDAPLDEMLRHHIDQHAAITIAAIPYTVSVPYAILSTDSQRVTALEEKPTYSYYANAGIYLLNQSALSIVNHNEPVDATDLIERAIDRGLIVTYFPLTGTWIDIGTPTDFRHAEEILALKQL